MTNKNKWSSFIAMNAEIIYLHRIMHDEVSETENIRKNLAIERMIVEGCEILLDTSQTFVRQGELPTRTHTHKSRSAERGHRSLIRRRMDSPFLLFFSANCHSCHLLLSSPPPPSSPFPLQGFSRLPSFRCQHKAKR